MKCILLIVVLYINYPLHVSACDFHPSLWCSSHDIAAQCKVSEQCSHFVAAKVNDAAPVKFTLYYESLCPDCKDFIKKQLWPAYKEVGNIMDLQLVPYGNAEEKKDGSKWKFQCQHGEEECTGNIIETCAIYILKNISAYFPFIHCMEISEAFPSKSAPQCAKQFGINYSAIKMCADGILGNQLEHRMAEKTEALHPTHQYVPWVTLNGVHNEQIQDEAEKNLLGLICNAYKGIKPPVCQSSPIRKCNRFNSNLKFTIG